MASELVDVEISFDGDVVDTFTSRLDPDSRSDLASFLDDMRARVKSSPKGGDAVQIWRRRTDLGTFHIATGRELKNK